MILKAFLILFLTLLAIAAPTTSDEHPTHPTRGLIVARARPSGGRGGGGGGSPPWVKAKFAAKGGAGGNGGSGGAPAGQDQSSGGQSQQQQPQGGSNMGSDAAPESGKYQGGRGGKGGKGGSSGSPSSDSSSSQPASGDSPPSGQQEQQQQQPASSGGSSGGGYMATVSSWRSKMGLSPFTQDAKLESNAMDTSKSSGGQLKHKLNSGSMGQVMAPGNSGNFESVFVGGWLCEMPQLPGLGDSVCKSASKGWDHAGQTGHAEILSSKTYKKIGCANAAGIWTCDVA